MKNLKNQRKFYLKRSSRVIKDILKYFQAYKEFETLNNDFLNVKYTNEINLPDNVKHFEALSEEKLDD